MFLIETFLKIAIFPRYSYIADLQNSPAFLWLEKTSLKPTQSTNTHLQTVSLWSTLVASGDVAAS